MSGATFTPIEDEDAERVTLEAAVATARDDPRPSVDHEEVRDKLLEDAAKARAKVSELAVRRFEG